MALNEKMSPPPEFLKAKKEAKESGLDVPEPEGLEWAYVSNCAVSLKQITSRRFVKFNI